MRLRIPNLVSRPNEVPVVAETASGSDVEVAGSQEMNEKNGPQTQVNSKFEDDGVSPEVQHGVQVAQAINQVWSREHLIAAYIIIWIINFIQGFGSGITGVLFSSHLVGNKANLVHDRHIDTLCYQLVPSTLAHRNYKYHLKLDQWTLEASLC
jgi:ribosomal protein L6P/L9E